VELVDALLAQEAAWAERPLVRRLYREWHEMIRRRLSAVSGPAVELGSGFGSLRETIPDVVLTDVEPTPWTTEAVDAQHMPYADSSLANLVLVDVFHHLARPRRFFDEAARVLTPGGRVVILDPYCSPVSTIAYQLFHQERTDLRAPALEDDMSVGASPLASNQARATLVFFRYLDQFERSWPQLAVIERRRLAPLAYPLSGGFGGRRLVPGFAHGPLAAVERLLQPLAPLLAFRCRHARARPAGTGLASRNLQEGVPGGLVPAGDRLEP
jgi:SAM-dependent methyltransferase